MPQMAPLLWFPLFVFFCSIFLMFTAFNYFIKPPIKMPMNMSTTLAPKLTWKW